MLHRLTGIFKKGLYVALALSLCLGWLNLHTPGVSAQLLCGGVDLTGDLRAVAYGGDKWLIARGPTIHYSFDGVNWTMLPYGSDDVGAKFNNQAIRDIAYGNGRWVAVGSYGRASYSDDGINWTALPVGDATGIKFGSNTHAVDVAYGNGRWVVVGARLASYSDDGINWTALPPSTTTQGLKMALNSGNGAATVTYGNGMWVATSQWGADASYSLDGVNWTRLEPGEGTGIIGAEGGGDFVRAVGYGNGKWIAAGRGGYASYSANGSTWVPLPHDAIQLGSLHQPSAVAYGGGRWVVIGAGPGSKISYSNDNGFNWIASEINVGTWAEDVAYHDGKWIAVGSLGGSASQSDDGITWTKIVPLACEDDDDEDQDEDDDNGQENGNGQDDNDDRDDNGNGQDEGSDDSNQKKANVTSFGGGDVTSDDGAVTLEFPPGSFSGDVIVSIDESSASPDTPSNLDQVGGAYNIVVISVSDGTEITDFNADVDVTIAFAGNAPDQSQIYYYDEDSQKWIALPTTVAGKTVSSKLNTAGYFSTFTSKLSAIPKTGGGAPIPQILLALGLTALLVASRQKIMQFKPLNK